MKNKLHISVVDDDKSVHEALENFIGSVGYEVDLFESAEDFLESPEINNTACLVLDLRMPGMSGLELQHKLRDQGRNIPSSSSRLTVRTRLARKPSRLARWLF